MVGLIKGPQGPFLQGTVSSFLQGTVSSFLQGTARSFLQKEPSQTMNPQTNRPAPSARTALDTYTTVIASPAIPGTRSSVPPARMTVTGSYAIRDGLVIRALPGSGPVARRALRALAEAERVH